MYYPMNIQSNFNLLRNICFWKLVLLICNSDGHKEQTFYLKVIQASIKAKFILKAFIGTCSPMIKLCPAVTAILDFVNGL